MTTVATLAGVGRERALAWLSEMLRIRRFEDRCAELYTATKIRGFLHLYVGEEAIAVGVMQALHADDPVFATYREHGHALARGVGMRAVMAEMYGKVEGCSRGRGGSMHLFDVARRFYGGSAIVGGALPMAVGMALAHQMRRQPQVTACFFGEGAVAEGEFHESMNLAQLWRLPVVFVCENNLYAMGTALERSESQTDLVVKARSYGTPAEAVDGMDVVEVAATAERLVAAVRSGGGPRFLECRTYRFRAHSMFDPELYREKDEVERWKQRCPIAAFTTRLRQQGWLDDAALLALEQRVATEVEDAVLFAERAAWEPVEELLRFVHSPREPR